MRVITGTARGKRLKEPTGMDIRPTTDMVKESIFNIIQFEVKDSRVLDAFAGTGQLGIEALSRGAKSAVFTDQNREALKLIRENLNIAGLSDKAQVTAVDALKFMERGEKFDIILLDPPYDTDLLDKAVKIATRFDILNNDGIIICESKKEKTIDDPEMPYYKHGEYKYGKIKLTVIRKRNGDPTGDGGEGEIE